MTSPSPRSDGGEGRGEEAKENHDIFEPISTPERIGAAMLIAATLLIGLYPRLLLDLIVPALKSPLFEGLWKVAKL